MQKSDKEQKEQIVQLINRWRERSKLSIEQIMARIQAQGYDINRSKFENRFIRFDQKPDIAPELTLAVIAAFTEGLTSRERCTAAEAIELANLTRLPIKQIERLRSFFPEEEFNEALRSYLFAVLNERTSRLPSAIIIDFKPKVEVRREEGTLPIPVYSFMPLYQNNVIYTYPDATAVFFCKDSKLLFRLLAERTVIVNCQNKTDKRVIGHLDTLLSSEEISLSEARMALQNLALSELAQGYLLFQLYRERGERDLAINQLKRFVETKELTSPHLWQQLGDLYFEVNAYIEAQENYQTALSAAQVNEDERAQAAAHIGLACAAHALNEEEQVLRYLKVISDSEYADIVGILLPTYEDQETQTYEGQVVPSAYTRFLAEKIAPHLRDKLRTIPDSFLKRLEALRGQFMLKQEASSMVGLGPGFEAMEVLAAIYLTTLTLIETLSISDIEEQAKMGELSTTLLHQAEKTAQEVVGLDPQRAHDFAERYARLVGRDLKALQALIRE